ncbi:Conjugal transfer protein TraG [Labeo rohita]|uniref:Conjugal transfer protein TraG n=1 Tax=Labeo rohita TaxID=84645 RepID=A0ABQ8MAW8_LABRO|nr:Conjugal transfer protein TraG [Labeo rohita]
MRAKLKLSSLEPQDLEIDTHSFITSRPDYRNALYMGLNLSAPNRLQLVQNATARLLMGTKRTERQHFSNLGISPLATELLSYQQPSRFLRSSDKLFLFIPRSRLKLKGDQAFSVVGPRLWNTIPLDIRSAPSLPVFKSRQ